LVVEGTDLHAVVQCQPPSALEPAASQPDGTPKKRLPCKSQYLLEAASKVAHAAFGGVAFLSGDGELVDNPAWGVAEDVASTLSESPWLQALIRCALQRSGPARLTADDARQFGDLPPGVPAIGSLLIIPLTRPGRVRGALYLVRSPDEPAFAPADEEAVAPIGVCLQQGNLIEEAALEAQLRLLNRVAQAAASSLEMASLFEATLRELDRHLPMCACAVWLENEATTGPRAEPRSSAPHSDVVLCLAAIRASQGIHAAELGLVPEVRLPLDQTPFAPCWQDREGGVYVEWQPPRMEPAAGDDERGRVGSRPAANATPSIYPCFATPLRAGTRTVGILQCVCSRPTGLKVEQVQLLYLVADLLGPAISNCQLFDRLRLTCEELRTTQAQLIRNEKLRAIGELASGMAHDFNNSLCGVVGFIEVTMMDKQLTSSSRSNLELARTCALNAAQTVHRVQDFARVRKNTGFLRVDVNDLVLSTLELTRPKWENLERSGKPIALNMETAAAVPILGNVAELREVLTNLVFNAVDAMPGGGTLTVRAWSEADTVLVSVTDTGLGMSPAVQQRLFEPFFTTKGERGNGMGLSVAFGIVKQHGGDITVASEPGRGSTFTLRLPVDTSSTARPVTNQPDKGQSPAQDAGPSLRVLVVEDQGAIRNFLVNSLTALGHRPHATRDGAEALDAFAKKSFDVVLTDLGLPGMNGEEVARRIADASPGMPIILLSGWAEQIKAQARPIPGVTRILGKPVSIDQLAENLMAVCPRPRPTP
jgi:signal transduction histidine kinase